MEASEPCCLKLRLDTRAETIPEEQEPPRGISGAPLPVLIKPFLNGEVADLNMTLLMSTVTSLVDLIEDEVVPEPLPMEVSDLAFLELLNFTISTILQKKLLRKGAHYNTFYGSFTLFLFLNFSQYDMEYLVSDGIPLI